jgi:hypothetical protein
LNQPKENMYENTRSGKLNTELRPPPASLRGGLNRAVVAAALAAWWVGGWVGGGGCGWARRRSAPVGGAPILPAVEGVGASRSAYNNMATLVLFLHHISQFY